MNKIILEGIYENFFKELAINCELENNEKKRRRKRKNIL